MPSSIRKALNELPTTLDDTYERALQGIPKEKRQHAHRLFHCLVGAIRPLRAEELAEIFAIDFDSDAISNLMEDWRPKNPEEAVLSTCSTLISVIEDKGTRIVQFSHLSVKEFLTSDRLRCSEVGNVCQYHVPLDSAHTILARACLATLLQLDEKVDKRRLATFPLAFYAAQHWVNHAKYANVASRVQEAMERVFNPNKPYLAAWGWLHDVEHDWVRRSIDDLTECPLPLQRTVLYYAALCGFSGVINYLIITHAEDVNTQSGEHGAPLHVVSDSGHAEFVYLLLQHNAGVNAKLRDWVDWTPLHFASFHGHTKVIELLLEYGADVNAQSTTQSMPLRFASENGHIAVVRLLLRHGADVHMQSKDGLTVLQRAMMCGSADIVQLLLGHGVEKEQDVGV